MGVGRSEWGDGSRRMGVRRWDQADGGGEMVEGMRE